MFSFCLLVIFCDFSDMGASELVAQVGLNGGLHLHEVSLSELEVIHENGEGTFANL